MEPTMALGIAAGVLQLAAFYFYNRRIFAGEIVPTTATWTLWAFLTVLNASSYAEMTVDVAKYILPTASAAATLATFAYSLRAGKFGRMDLWGKRALALGIAAGCAWWWYKSAAYANIILVVAIAISFIPLYEVVWRNPAIEKPLPWFVWTAAFGTLTLVNVLRWQGDWMPLVYPVSMVVLHAAAGVLACRRLT